MAKILIAEARFYAHLNDMLLAVAPIAVKSAGTRMNHYVPGALSFRALPAAAESCPEACRNRRVIRGETYHFEVVAGESARGLMALTMDGIAVGNGILTVENEAQAIVRADPAQGDKGGDAAKAALALMALQRRFTV